MVSSSLWQRFQNYFLRYDDLDFSIDISRMIFSDEFFDKTQPRVGKALAAMGELEAGAIAIDADPEDVFHVPRQLAVNNSHLRVTAGDEPADDKFSLAK
jgi:hypothetical protein